MSSTEITYFREGAAAERQLAGASANPVIAGIHEQMAELYEALIEHELRQATLHSVAMSDSAARSPIANDQRHGRA